MISSDGHGGFISRRLHQVFGEVAEIMVVCVGGLSGGIMVSVGGGENDMKW